jgi:glycosyltransferase involved in cell wall biosynthesis
MKKKTITIITVTKNDSEGVIKTNQSLKTQTDKNWIHLIIDGESSAYHLRKLKALRDKSTFLYSGPDSGIYSAMNKGWKLAPIDSWIIFLNSGDTLLNRNSLAVLNTYLKKPSSGVFVAPFEQVNPKENSSCTKLISKPSIRNQLFYWGYVSHQSMIIRRMVYDKVGGFDEIYKVASDWDLYSRILQTYKVNRINRPITRFFVGGFSTQNIFTAHKEVRKLQSIYLKLTFKERFVRLIWEVFSLGRLKSQSAPSRVISITILKPFSFFLVVFQFIEQLIHKINLFWERFLSSLYPRVKPYNLNSRDNFFSEFKFTLTINFIFIVKLSSLIFTLPLRFLVLVLGEVPTVIMIQNWCRLKLKVKQIDFRFYKEKIT